MLVFLTICLVLSCISISTTYNCAHYYIRGTTIHIIPDIAQRGETGSVRALMRSEDVQNKLLSINPMSMTIPYALTAVF